MKAKFKVVAKDDEMELMEFKSEFLTYSTRTLPLTQMKVALDEPFKDPKYYRNIIDAMDSMSENDQVEFRINSPGGRLDGLLGLLEAVRNTDADVVAHITGECHSAASIFALSCPSVSVSPYASMLIHSVSYGVGGKDADIVNHVMHTSEFCRDLFLATYRFFLTDKEIDECLMGKELWLKAGDIERRLETRQKAYEKLYKQQEAGEKKAKAKPKVKPSVKTQEFPMSEEPN
jgi:ATP-dependent protease ClpP protease subunit